MAGVSMSQKLNAQAMRVWERIGDFATLHEWHPAIERTDIEGSGIGALRTLHLAGGAGTVQERLDGANATARSYTYTILDSPLPVANYQATIQVTDQGDGTCTVYWASTFDADGASDADAEAAIRGVYDAGFGALRQEFGG